MAKPKVYKKRFPRSKRKDTLALKAYRMAKKATQTMELHKLDYSGTFLLSGNDFVSVMMSNPPENDTSGGRTGLRIWARSLRFHYELVWGSLSTQVQQVARVIIVRDKLQAGVRPTVTQILEEASAWTTLSQRNNTTEGKRFVFLYDKVHRPARQVIGDTYSTGRKIIVPLKFPIHYTGSTGTEASQNKNSVYMFAVADIAVGTNAPTLRFTSRFFFDP